MMKQKHSYGKVTLLKLTLVIFVIMLILSFRETEAQTTVNLGSMKDNTLYEDEGGFISNGSGQYFFAGKTAGDMLRRGVIAFDIAGSIPSNATVTSVTLTLRMSKTISGNKNVKLQKILQNWGEGTSSPGGEEGFGAAAEPGDATWLHSYYDTTAWTDNELGGYFSHDVSATASVGAVGFYTWGSTTQMVSDVQGWLSNPTQNGGWILIGDESSTASAKRFDTKENLTAVNRPKLTVTYTLNFVSLNLTTFIEGFWDGTSMVSDTARVYLANSSSPFNFIDSSKGILNTNGSGTFTFANAPGGSYFIVVNHRNTIETWSSSPQTFTAGTPLNYNFSLSAGNAYGNNQILKLSKYCIYSGDVNKDGIVDASDISSVENDAVNSVSGYVQTDVTGDDYVDSSDISLVENNAALAVELLKP